MRPHSAAKREQHRQSQRNYHEIVEVKNVSGTWIDVSSWVESWSIDTNLDNQVSTAQLELIREDETASLAPLMGGSDLNRKDDDTYSPLLWPHREIRIRTATTESGVAPVAGDWDEVFSGYVDDVGWQENPVIVPCRDKGAVIQDTIIEEEIIFNEDANVPLEDQVEALVSPVVPTPDYVVLDDPGADVGAYTQSTVNRMEAARAIAQLRGFDVRYKYDAAGVSRLTLYEPDRAKTIPDATFAASEYFNVTNLNVGKADIRNVIDVWYLDSAGNEQKVHQEDAASIAEFGRRYMRIGTEATKGVINNSTDAAALATIALLELSQPWALQEIECSYFPYAELGDLYEWVANNIHYDSNQKFAVAGFRHVSRNGDITTFITTRGKPAAFHKDWFRKPRGGIITGTFDATIPPELSFTVTPAGVVTAKVAGSDGTYVTRCVGAVGREPSQEEVDASTPSTPGARTGFFPGVLVVPAAKRFNLAARAYNSAGEGTAVVRLSDVWLGIGSTAGPDVIFGTITAQVDKILFGVAFDDECAYCEIWMEEHTTNPAAVVSVEGNSGMPFRVLTLGADAMRPGIQSIIILPLSGPTNWQVSTWVPFDHLGNRGRPVTHKIRGSTGVNDPGDPGDIGDFADIPNNELDLEAASLVPAFAVDDPIDTWPDLSGFGNDAVQTVAAEKPLLKVSANGNLVARFSGTEDANGDSMYTPFAVEASPVPAPWTLLVAYAPLGDGTFDWAPVIGGTDSFWNSFFLHANPTSPDPNNDNHRARVTWAGGSILMGPEANVDEMVIALVRSGAGGDNIVDYFVNNQFIGSGDGGNLAGFGGGLTLGRWGGYFGHMDIAIVAGWSRKLTDEECFQAMDLASQKINTPIPPPPLGDPPDPPTAISQIAQTSSSITVRVTMPAVAPEYVRLFVGGLYGFMSFDVPVTVAGGANQDIVIQGLYPEASYPISVASLDNGLLSTEIGFIGFTDPSSGTLDAPTIDSVVYNIGDQSFTITITPGANNPLDTWYDVEYEDVPSDGWQDDLSASVQYHIIRSDFPQVVGADRTRWFRITARRLGWNNSPVSNSMSGVAPAA